MNNLTNQKDGFQKNSGDFSASQEQYLKTEYDKLNKDILSIIAEIQSREKYSLLIIAGVAAWLFTNLESINHFPLIALSIIPIITTSINGFSAYYLYKNLKWISIYLTQIEDHFLPANEAGSFGWEKYYTKQYKRSDFVFGSFIIWPIQLALSILLLCFAYNSNLVKHKTSTMVSKEYVDSLFSHK